MPTDAHVDRRPVPHDAGEPDEADGGDIVITAIREKPVMVEPRLVLDFGGGGRGQVSTGHSKP